MKDFVMGIIVALTVSDLYEIGSGFYNATYTGSELRCLKAKANFPEYTFKEQEGMCVWVVSPSVHQLLHDARTHKIIIVEEGAL